MSSKKRGRKPIEPSLIRFDRINELMRLEGIEYQSKLAEEINIPQQSFSRIMSTKKISETIIHDIIHRFPEYREEWLLGYDDIPTHKEKAAAQEKAFRLQASILVLDEAVKEVCAREKMDVPELDNIPELLLLQAQLKDFAISLMSNYLKYRKESCFWSYLDQIDEKGRCNNG